MEITTMEVLERIDFDKFLKLINYQSFNITMFGFLKLAKLNPKNISSLKINQSPIFRYSDDIHISILNTLVLIVYGNSSWFGTDIMTNLKIDSELRLHSNHVFEEEVMLRYKSLYSYNSFFLDTCAYIPNPDRISRIKDSKLNYLKVSEENNNDSYVVEHANVLTMKHVASSKRLKLENEHEI